MGEQFISFSLTQAIFAGFSKFFFCAESVSQEQTYKKSRWAIVHSAHLLPSALFDSFYDFCSAISATLNLVAMACILAFIFILFCNILNSSYIDEPIEYDFCPCSICDSSFFDYNIAGKVKEVY